MTLRRQLLVMAGLLAGCSARQDAGPPPALTASIVQVIQGDGQTDTVGQQLPSAIRIVVLDTTGPAGVGAFEPSAGTPIPVPGQLVNFVVTSGGGHVFAGSAVTDSLGRAQELWTLGPTAGSQCLEARAVDQETGTPITFAQICATGLPGPLATAHFAVHSLQAELGTAVALPIAAADQYGNAVDAPAPTVLDTASLTASGSGWQATPGMLGSPRLVLGTDTLRLAVHPRSGPYDLKLAHVDTVWHETGTLTRLTTVPGTPWCPVAGSQPADSAALYRATGVVVTRQVGAGAIDTIATAAVRDSVLCHHAFQANQQYPGEQSAYLRPLFSWFTLGSSGEVSTLAFGRDSARAWFPLNIGGLTDTLFVTR